MYPPVRFKFLIVQILKQYFQIQGNFESNLIITLLDSFSRFDSEDRKPKNNLCFHYQFTNFKLQIHSETKQNHIDNHFLQFDFQLKTCKPSMWDPIEENYSAHTDTSQDLTFEIFAGMKNWEKWDMCQTSGNRSNQFHRKRLKYFLKQQIYLLKSVNSNFTLAAHSPKFGQAKTHFLSHHNVCKINRFANFPTRDQWSNG